MNSVFRRALTRAYRELIADRRKQTPFWMLVGFLPTYIIARLTVHFAPSLFLDVHGVHVHHFAYGIIVLSIVGFVAIAVPRAAALYWLAILYGIGLALSFDEFGMWIHMTTNYNLDTSEDVMSGLLAFLVIVVYCLGILRRAISYLPGTYRFSAKKKSS